ncbi:MAG: toll/interleukin-1 receptor domain-containing protein [Firmicutes bacterium]|nr:toll/interleukin-1 receptor domain-containing protein [Bacillota bacterium]
MAIFKCKMCGGDLNPEQGKTVCECEFCGTTQTIPPADDEKKTNLFNRATQLRRANEFDRAIAVYEQLIAQFPDEAEAYWGMVLCEYGIEYVDDPLTYKKIPTCHRTSYDSIFDSVNYKLAVEKADSVAAELYRREAETISNIQKDILKIAKNEKPFDIFICYKETDDAGNRTQDSVLAQDLYYQLTQEGFKVFFSRITLEGKLGTQYEPYIFAALNSAKVMVVVGTKPEYYNAVWLKNEWSRFLALMKRDKNKIIIPAYRDMDPYDLPDALSMFQAQDMSKLGFMQDLVRGIKKVVGKDAEKSVSVSETAARSSSAAGSNAENLLKRGMLALEGGKWDEADSFFEQVLNVNVEEARAYWGKLLAQYKCRTEDELKNQKYFLDGSENYIYTVRFGNEELKNKALLYNNIVRYNSADKELNAARTEKNIDFFEDAYMLFGGLGDYLDSRNKAKECRTAMYSGAVSLLDEGEKNGDITAIEKAGDIFKKLYDYDGAKDKYEDCVKKKNEVAALDSAYAALLEKYNKLGPINARNAVVFCSILDDLTKIENHKKAAELARFCRKNIYDCAVSLARSTKNKKCLLCAKALFTKLGAYEDSADKLKNCEKALKKLGVHNFFVFLSLLIITAVMAAVMFLPLLMNYYLVKEETKKEQQEQQEQQTGAAETVLYDIVYM